MEKISKVLYLVLIASATFLVFILTGSILASFLLLIVSVIFLQYKNSSLCDRAQSALAALDHQKALQLSEKAIQQNPKEPRAYVLAASACNCMAKFGKAVEYCSTAISLAPEYMSAYTVRADANLLLGEYQKATEDATKALSFSDKYPEPYIVLAGTSFKNLSFEQSLDYSNKALKRSDQNPYALHRKACALLCLYRIEEAKNILDDVIRLSEQHRSLQHLAYILRSESHTLHGNLDSALDDCNVVLSSDPKHTSALLQRAWLYVLQEKFDEALFDLKQVQPGSDSDVLPSEIERQKLQKFSLLLLQTNQYDQALEKASTAISINNKSFGSYTVRGLIYARQKQYDSALSDFSKALELNPFLSDAYWLRSRVWEKLGEEENAEKDRLKSENSSYVPLLDID